MKNLCISGIIIMGITTVLLSCSTRHISQDEIAAFVKDFERKIQYIDKRIAEVRWEILTGHEYDPALNDTLEYYYKVRIQLTGDPQQLATIKAYLSLVKDDQIGRKLELISRRCKRVVVEGDGNINLLIGSIQSTFEAHGRSMGSYTAELKAEANRDRRRDIYTEMMKPGDAVEEDVVLVARKRNLAVSRMGYNSYYDFMLSADGIDKSELMKLLDQLDRLSAEKYQRALDSLMNVMRLDDIRLWDIDYAFRMIDEQTAEYFTADKHESILRATLKGMGFRLRNMPVYFEAIERSGEVSEREIMVVHIPDDIRVPVHGDDGGKSLRVLFGQAGEALYAAHVDPQDYLLTQSPAPCFREALVRIIDGLTELKAWKRKYAGLPEPLVIESANKENFMRLYRLRRALVDIHFERAMYADPFADLQQVYARLFEKYMLFPLGDDFRPWAAGIHYLTRPVDLQNQLIAECIAAQTYHYLIEKYESVLDNQHTREFLVQNYYRFGSRDQWQVLLSRGTGEKLNADYYFYLGSD